MNEKNVGMALILITVLTSLAILTPVNALKIVVTFPSLEEDLKLIAVNDTVESIKAFSHEYQLTPRDVELLRSADVIISTAHTHFELRIREMVERGEIKAKLIEIPKIEGIKILKNPETHQKNLHMPIYDPKNYIVFLRYVAGELESMNPKEDYRGKVEIVEDRLKGITNKRLEAKAIADYPSTQYAVTWLGVNVTRLVVKEHDLPVTPDVSEIIKSVKSGEITLVVVTKPVVSKQSQMLLEIARENGIRVLYVESPLSKKSVLEKLKYISEQVDVEVEEEKRTPGFGFLTALMVLAFRRWIR